MYTQTTVRQFFGHLLSFFFMQYASLNSIFITLLRYITVEI